MSNVKVKQAHNKTFYMDKVVDSWMRDFELMATLARLTGKTEPGQVTMSQTDKSGDDEILKSAVCVDLERGCKIYLTLTDYSGLRGQRLELGLDVMPVPLDMSERPDLKEYARELAKKF